VIALYFGALAFFEEGIAFFDPIYSTPMNEVEYYISFGVTMCLALQLIVMAHRFYGLRPNIPLLVCGVLLFISTTVGTFQFQGSYAMGNSVIVTYPMDLRMRDIFANLNTFLAIYIILGFFPKMVRSSRTWNAIFLGIIIVAVIGTVYSYCTEFSRYQAVFDPDVVSFEYPQSFTNSRNTYGTLLLFGILSCMYMNVKNHRWWYFLIAMYLFINQLFVLSKTCIIITLIIYPVYLIWLYAKTVRKHPYISTTFLGLLVLAIIAMYAMYCMKDVEGLANYRSFIDNFVEAVSDNGSASLQIRHKIWNVLLTFLFSNPLYIVFGVGKSMPTLMATAAFSPLTQKVDFFADSGYVQTFVSFGAVGLIAFVALICYAFVLIISNFRRRETSFISMLILITFLMHAYTECDSLLWVDTKSLVFLATIFLPEMTDAWMDGKEAPKEFENAYPNNLMVPKKTPLSADGFATMAMLALTPLLIACVGYAPLFRLMLGAAPWDNPNSISAFIIVCLLAPFAFAEAYSVLKNRSAAAGWLGIVLSALYLVSGVTFAFLYDSVAVPIASGAIGVILLTFFILGADRSSGLTWRSLKPLLFYSLIAVSFIGAAHLTAAYGGVSEDTRYISLALAALLIAAYGFICFALPVGEKVNAPICAAWLNVEKKAFVIGSQAEIVEQHRADSFFVRKTEAKEGKLGAPD
jgi:hypothetical protein